MSMFDVMARRAFIIAINKFVPVKVACKHLSVTPRTYYNWMAKGKKEYREGLDTDYTQFYLMVHEAHLKRIKRGTNRIQKAGRDPKRWQAMAWLLERVEREDFTLNGDFQQAMEDRMTKIEAMLGQIARPSAITYYENSPIVQEEHETAKLID